MPPVPTGPLLPLAAALLLGGCAGLEPARLARGEPGAAATLDRMAPNACNPRVAEALAGAGVAMARVDGMVYGLYRNIRSDRIEMYDAWVSLRDQPGSVIVQMDGDCTLRQVYARDGARLPGSEGPGS